MQFGHRQQIARLTAGPRPALLALLLLCGCAAYTALQTSQPKRTLHVKVVADLSFADNSRWRDNVTNLMTNASSFFTSWFEIAFVVDTMEVWDCEHSACGQEMFDWDCLVASVPKGRSDLVVYFTKERDPGELGIAGISLFTEGYVRVTQAQLVNTPGGYEVAFVTLVHELSHQFGAVHVFHNENFRTLYVMTPFLSEKLLEKRGKDVVLQMPDYHPANQAIITALRNRPFGGAVSCDSCWRQTAQAYAAARRTYADYRIAGGDRLSGFERNEVYQADMDYFLAHWAAMFGRDSLALAYLDSALLVSKALRNTCLDCGRNCQSQQCIEIWRATGSYERWYQGRLAGHHYQKALLLLSMGRPEEAHRQLVEFNDAAASADVAWKRRCEAGFRYYETRYAGRTSRPQGRAEP